MIRRVRDIAIGLALASTVAVCFGLPVYRALKRPRLDTATTMGLEDR